METNKREAIKKAVFISVLFLLIIIVGFITIKYEIEGERNLPFKLGKIRIISTADGIKTEENEIQVWQVNDIYFSIEKNEEYAEKEIIRRIGIENISVNEKPEIGKVVFYRPSNKDGATYIYEEDLIIKNEIEYFGDTSTDLKTLSISNQGGIIGIRSCLKNIGSFTQSEEENNQIISQSHDATLLQRAGIDMEKCKYQLQFDITIELESDKKYRANIVVDLPNEDMEGQTVKGIELTDLENIVFKRLLS